MMQFFPHLHIVLTCGEGTDDLWPLARKDAPREMQVFPGDSTTLLVRAVQAASAITQAPLTIVCTPSMADCVRDHLVGQGVFPADKLNLLTLPHLCGTAFSLALAATYLKQQDQGAIILTWPAGVRFEEDELWEAAITRAYQVACEDRIAIVGLKTPSGASPLLSPVQPSSKGSGSSPQQVAASGFIRSTNTQFADIPQTYPVKEFIEHPPSSFVTRMNQPTAFWNTGIACAKANIVLGEYYQIAATSTGLPEQERSRLAQTASFLVALGQNHWNRKDANEIINSLPQASFAEAVLETSQQLVVVDSSLTWQDVTSLAAVDGLAAGDEKRNHASGNTKLLASSGTTVYAGASNRLIATLGLRNVLVVDTPDATLVASKEVPLDVAPLVAAIREQHLAQADTSPIDWYPWGKSTLLLSGEGFEVRKLDFLAGARMKHTSRNDAQRVWTVLAGTGMVAQGDRRTYVSHGASLIIEASSFAEVRVPDNEALTILEVITSE